MEGFTKVIDELGMMILAKDILLVKKEKEIEELKAKIEAIEEYINFCESQC